jgi:hypothetical protein
MKWKFEFTINQTTLISRRIFWSFIGVFIFTGLISTFTETYNVRWLNIFVPFIGWISLILLAISWLMPGILILLGVPWFAHAWLRGINPIGISSRPFEQMSNGEIFLIYFYSIIISAFMVVAIIAFVRFNFQK